MCICMDCWFPILFNRLLKSIIVICFDLQIIPNLASEKPLKAGLFFDIFLSFFKHFLAFWYKMFQAFFFF